MNTEKTLKQISIENLNNCINRIAENRRQLKIAKLIGDKNGVLKLTFQKQNLENELEYHLLKVNE